MDIKASHVLVVAGPTSSGKSSFAIRLAEKFNGAIINADSMQVYRDLRILTSRPSQQVEERVFHTLYGHLDGSERCSVMKWYESAVQEINRAYLKGLLPIIVGGSGFYIKTLLEGGLNEIPEIESEVKYFVNSIISKEGSESVYNRLQSCDPSSAINLNPQDSHRVARAYQVFLGTGIPLSKWQNRSKIRRGNQTVFYKILFNLTRKKLYSSCDQRFEKMINSGVIDEVSSLISRQLDNSLPIMRALGVRELSSYLVGRATLEEAVERSKQATRNYAKRQITWFKNQFNASFTISEQLSESFLEEFFPNISKFLLT